MRIDRGGQRDQVGEALVRQGVRVPRLQVVRGAPEHGEKWPVSGCVLKGEPAG